MTPDLLITLAILLGAIILLVGGFLRNDLIAALIITALMLSGVLDVADALSGFSSSAVIIIASMYVIGEAIINTGIAQRVGGLIIRYGGSNETRILIMLMTAAGLVGSFMSSTATAAIFVPIALSVAEKAGINHRRLLMPLSAAALVSGMMTLVATTPNIVVNNILQEKIGESLSFFSFTPFGLLILVLSILFMIFCGQNLLAAKDEKVERSKEPNIDDLLRFYHIDQSEYFFRIPALQNENCQCLIDYSVARMRLGAEYHITLLAIRSIQAGRSVISPARPESVFKAGDLLMVVGTPENAAAFAEAFGLIRETLRTDSAERRAFFKVVGVAEVMLNPDSSLIGKSLVETNFQVLYHALVLGIRRKGVSITENVASLPLKFGDVLLACGPWDEILRLGQNREQYLLLTMPQDSREFIPAKSKEKLALIILAAMVASMVAGLLTPVAAIFSAAVALLLTRCVFAGNIYSAIDWPTIILIAGILPLALAMQRTGMIAHVSDTFLSIFSGAGPLVVLAGLFVTTALLGLVMSNTAVAVLLAPMSVDIALKLAINPEACLLAVALACSAAFVSPLGSTVNMIVREPGGYSLKDFAIVGTPLLLISLLATLGLLWVLYL